MLRDVATRGPWVSAHPDVILKMGVKEVLFRTKHLGWGTDTHLYRTPLSFREEFPPRLIASPRVLKQNRGNGGQGVWKVEWISEGRGAGVRVLRSGSVLWEMPLGMFWLVRALQGRTDASSISRPSPGRLTVRSVAAGRDKVVGFGHQFIKALIPPPRGPDAPDAPRAGDLFIRPRPSHSGASIAMESEGTPQMMEVLTSMRITADNLGCRFSVWAADSLG